MSQQLLNRFSVLAALCLLVGAWSGPSYADDPDPGLPDPDRPVTRDVYDFGDQAFFVTDPDGTVRAVEFRASVHSPTDLSDGPFPLVLFLHGGAPICYSYVDDQISASIWPCINNDPIPNYIGYDYIAEVLASHGYIAISISANGIGGDIQSRAELIQAHLDKWYEFNTTGAPPFDDRFIGKVDLNNVGTMGHSLGGGGVVRQFFLNQSQGSPYGIRAIMTVGGTNSRSEVINNVALGVMLPYCDGEVRSLPSVGSFDAARYSVDDDATAKHTILVMGANHRYFNTIWTSDDWLGAWMGIPFVFDGWKNVYCGTVEGNQRLSPEEQQAVAAAYIAGFFRLYLGGETEFLPLFKGDTPPPPSAMTDQVFVSYHAPAQERLDVNRISDAGNLTVNTLGGGVGQTGLNPYDLCGMNPPGPLRCTGGLLTANREPHAGGLLQLRLGWDAPGASYLNELPIDARDVSGFRTLQFRASVNFDDPRNALNEPQDFHVVLSDEAEEEVSVRVSDHSDVLFFPPGFPEVEGAAMPHPVPRILLNTIRIPLTAFSGVDLQHVASIRFDFGLDGSPASGAILVSDLAFADANGAPHADAGPDQSLECTSSSGTPVTLDGTASTDPDGDALSYVWTGPFGTTSCAEPTVDLPLGENEITLTVTDGFGATSSDTVTVWIGGDEDGDGICIVEDNCLAASNSDQGDSDLDGFGNLCDADFDDSGAASGTDFLYLKQNFGTSAPSYDEQLDMDCNGAVGVSDWTLFLNLFGTQYGAGQTVSGLACAGTAPCPATAHGCVLAP